MHHFVAAFTVSLSCLGCGSATFADGSVQFLRHDIDSDAEIAACAIVDVDQDGQLDIVSGGFWYKSPTWERRFIREVEMIRGRFDDYSNLPIDVNGDGWTDLVSANYRSNSLYWVEHPGPSMGTWQKHVIDTPGRSETGRLADVDGDGRLDLLPNGTDFAAWYEIKADSNPGAKQRATWLRHELPPELIGHGIGFGDINGDGRNDIVGPRGWLEAPEDRRRGRWIWHAEFDLGPGTSIPILVMDVDSDGDADLIWGRGHDIGLYWLEQTSDEEESRTWSRHAIDTSWSQPHSILQGDVNNDGQTDVIAGKRYLGHDGRDPAEYDPLCVYWYEFDNASRSWCRHLVSWNASVGFGLDPKVGDLDGDGDLDIVTGDRSGLYWLENLLVAETDVQPNTAQPPSPPYDGHTQLFIWQDKEGRPHEVSDPFQWSMRRIHILEGMERAMGELPDPVRRVPLDVEIHDVTETPKYSRKRISYTSEPGDRVPACLLIPNDIRRKTAAILCLHPTSPLGKDQVAGLGGKPSRFYGHELAERGYVCLIPDYPSFGEYKYDFRSDGKHYKSGSMKAIWNNIRAVDLLETLPEVDERKIGAIGHSLGGHNALFTAAFDQRLRCLVTSCGFTAFAKYYDGNLAGWTSDRYMPLIRDSFGNDPKRVPFDFHEVLAAMAPRGVFINAPLHDDNFDVDGVKEVVAAAAGIYGFLDASDKLTAIYPNAEHDFPDDVRESAYRWLDRQFNLKTAR